jgi:hypothetical protein
LGFIVVLQGSFQGGHRRGERLGVFRSPALEDFADGNGVEVVQLLAAVAPRDHEAPALEHAQVLHGAEAGHAAVAAELGERLAVALEQLVEQATAVPIGERLEDPIHVTKYR